MGQLFAKNGLILGPIPKISQKTFFFFFKKKNQLPDRVQIGTSQ
jgi:hypothetical protein